MKTNNFHSLAARLSFWIVLLGTTVFASVLTVNNYYSHDLISLYIEKLARSHANSTTLEIEATVDTAKASADSLASVIAHTRINEKQIHQAIKAQLNNNASIFGMAVALEPRILKPELGEFCPYYLRDNNLIKYANLATRDYQYLKQDWYTEPKSLNQSVWSEPYNDTGGGNVLMTTYSSPILINTDKQFAGVATADIKLGWLNNVVNNIAKNHGGSALIVSEDDIVIASPIKSHIKKPLQLVLKETSHEENWDIYLSSKLSTKPVYKKVSCKIYEGLCWIAIKPLGKTSWTIVIAYSDNELVSKINELAFNVAKIAIAGLIALLITVIVITRYFTKPLAQLASASKDIGAGYLDTTMPKPQRNDEIGSLTDDFSHMRDALKSYIDKLQESTAKRQKLESEIQIAKDIQMSMVPGAGNVSVKGTRHQLYTLLRPARTVGGDLYYFQLSEDGLLNFIIGDVSDKGVPAALFMAKAITIYTQTLRDKLSPGQSLTMMNDLLEQNNDACMFVTALCGALNTQTGELVMANAAHMHPIQKTSSKTEELEIDGSTALGLMEGASYADTTTQLKTNTALVMYTDGISEAFNSSDEQYSEERLIEFVNNETFSNAENLGSHIMSDVDQFADVSEQFDDITLMVIIYGSE